VPALAEAALLEEDVLEAGVPEVVAEREAGLAGADDERLDRLPSGGARRPDDPDAARRDAGHASTPM
jgi:hypothetical protein